MGDARAIGDELLHSEADCPRMGSKETSLWLPSPSRAIPHLVLTDLLCGRRLFARGKIEIP